MTVVERNKQDCYCAMGNRFWRNKKVWDGKQVSPSLAVDWSAKVVNE